MRLSSGFFELSFISLCLVSGGGYSGNQENRYVGFGNTVTPEKKEDDFINNAMTSIYSVGHSKYLLSELYFLLYFSPPLAISQEEIFLFFLQGWSNFAVGASKFASIAKDNVGIFIAYWFCSVSNFI